MAHRHCVEKSDIVQLVLETYKAGNTTGRAAPAAAATLERSEPFDLSRWRHMALFIKAEADEAAYGRTPAVVAAYKASVEACRANDDELYGCLAGWNAVKVVMNGSSVFRIGDVLQLMDYAVDCKAKLTSWNGYLFVQPRINVLRKPLRDDIKVSHHAVSS